MKSCACSSVIRTFLDRSAAVTSFASSLRRCRAEDRFLLQSSAQWHVPACCAQGCGLQAPAVMVGVEGIEDFVQRITSGRDAAPPLPYLRASMPHFTCAPTAQTRPFARHLTPCLRGRVQRNILPHRSCEVLQPVNLDVFRPRVAVSPQEGGVRDLLVLAVEADGVIVVCAQNGRQPE